ncbi:MAG TPA: phosphatase PAP2 family protein, partial [Cyclobacteriaceae bacterium]|nr:phosphatase PAP2 family protein [Cyclobacteriaceae bacterium]
MLQYLLELDTEVFLFFNRMHHPVMDSIMWFMSGISNWIPLYLVFIALIIKNYQKETWLILLAIALVILAADQITSGFMKPFFERLRPSHEPALDGLVHTVNDYKGGRFGFASGHSSNSFAIATILFLLFRQKYTW